MNHSVHSHPAKIHVGTDASSVQRPRCIGPLRMPASVVSVDPRSKLKNGNNAMSSVNEMIVRDPDILGGTPVFRGTRVPFQTLLEYLEGGQTLDQFLEDFPTVRREVAINALEHAKSLVLSEL